MAKIFPFGTKKNPKPTVPPAGDQTGRPSRPLLAYRIAPFIVFLLLFEGVIFGWYYVKKSVNQQAYAKFEAELEEAKLLIKDRIDVYIDALYGLQALFAASREVERGEWAEYIRASGFRERYPGIVAFAYVEVVPRNRVGPFVESVRKDTTFSPLGFPNFDIYPVGEREEYYVTKYIEPYRGNEEMLGFDAGTRPERLSVMKEARDTGEPVATGRVRLLSEGEEPVGFLIFLPIYRLDAPISTAEERRAALIGFVEAIFKADDLLSGIFGKKSIHPEIGFQIYDGGAKIKRKLLYDDEKVLKVMYTGFRPRFTEDRTLEVAGRLWTLYFSALPKFGLDKTQEEFPIYVLLGGTLFSVLIFGVLYSFSTSRSQAVSIAEKMTSKLRQSEHRYADLIENAPDPIITLDRMGRLQSMNPMAEKISGYRAQELLGRYFATMNILTVPSLSKALSEFALAVVGKERPPFELDLMTREGDQITVEANPRPIKEGGKTVAIQVIFRDITARKKTERTLRDFGTYLDKIINSVGDPIFVKDRKHRLVLLNDAYCHLIGTGREELLGKTEKDVFPKEEARVSQAREEDVFRTGKENVAEENFTDSHGITHIIVSKRTLYTDTKGDAFIVGIIRDVTDQKQAEENIRQLNQILRRRNIELSGTNKELEAFSYSGD
jgi:PAS domain S-box-containing protein